MFKMALISRGAPVPKLSVSDLFYAPQNLTETGDIPSRKKLP